LSTSIGSYIDTFYTNYFFIIWQKCHGIVLTTVCNIEKEFSWYYQACTKCAGRVKTIVGQLFCPKCNTGRNVMPRCVLWSSNFFPFRFQFYILLQSISFSICNTVIINGFGRFKVHLQVMDHTGIYTKAITHSVRHKDSVQIQSATVSFVCMFCNDNQQKSRTVTQASWCLSSTTCFFTRSALCCSI